jgi:hypothetical protein
MNDGVKEVFETAIRAVIHPQRRPKDKKKKYLFLFCQEVDTL